MAAMPTLGENGDVHGLAEAIVATLREPLLVLDSDLRVIAASRSFYAKFKVGPDTVLGRTFEALGDGQWNIPTLSSLLRDLLPQHSVVDAFEVEHSFPDLGERIMLLNAREIVRDGVGNLILVAIEDITDRRIAERAIAALLKDKEILLREMQHRVANSLQIIASILLIKARTVGSADIRLHLEDAHQRIMSVATLQRQLQPSYVGEDVQLGPYLSSLCAALAKSVIGHARPITIEVRAIKGSTSSDVAVSLGLVVTELVINAIKHAFPGEARERDGVIRVSYDADGSNWVLAVSDNGDGNADGAAAPPGLGTNIVQALVAKLDCRIETAMTPHGTTVSIAHGTMPSPLRPLPDR